MKTSWFSLSIIAFILILAASCSLENNERSIANSNADLSDIRVTSGVLIPDFNKDITNYSVYLGHSTVSVGIVVENADQLARVEITPAIPLTLSVGENPVSILVTAQDGTQKQYHINIIRADLSSKRIIDFSLTGLEAFTYIDESSKTIWLAASVESDISSLSAEVVHTGKNILPDPALARDYRLSVNYRVNAEDNSFQDYTVNVVTPDENIGVLFFSANAPDARGSMMNLKIQKGVSVTLPPCGYTRDGYLFAGWATSPDAPVKYENEASFQMNENSLVLYAVWKPLDFTITFYPNGGLGDAYSQEMTIGIPEALDACAFSREGYSFAGWATWSHGEVEYGDLEVVSSLTQDLSLFAVWNPNGYHVTFDPNGGQGQAFSEVFYYEQGRPLPQNPFTQENYSFMGWATSRDGEVDYANGQKFYTDLADIRLYAVWKYFYDYVIQSDAVEITNYTGSDKDVEIPPFIEGYPVKIIGLTAFSEDNSIVTVKIPDTVVSIHFHAFRGCSNLESVELGNSVESISGGAFSRCSKLVTVDIPASVNDLDSGSFLYSNMLQSITVDSANSSYTSVEGIVFSKNREKLIIYPPGRSAASYVVPYSVTAIASYAFSTNRYLESINLPNNVETVSVMAFSDMPLLTSITLGSRVSHLDYTAFSGSVLLAHINVNSANPHYSAVDDILFNKDQTILYIYPPSREGSSYTIASPVVEISHRAFYYNKYLTSVVIGDSVERIDSDAFRNMSSLVNMTIGASVTDISYNCFDFSRKLISVTINAPSPPKLHSEFIFDNNHSDRKFYVPPGTLVDYQTAPFWSEYYLAMEEQ